MKKIVIAVLLLTLNIFACSKDYVSVEAPIKNITDESSAWYIGAGIVGAKLSGCNLKDCSYEDVTYGVMVRGGYEVNQYFGIEARAIKTYWDKGPYGGTPLQHIGLFVKPQYPVSERVNLYALFGYGYTKNLGNGARLDYFDHDHGFSAGVGLELDLSDKKHDRLKNVIYDREFDGHADQGTGWSLFVDYQKLLIKPNRPELNVVSVGIRYDF